MIGIPLTSHIVCISHAMTWISIDTFGGLFVFIDCGQDER